MRFIAKVLLAVLATVPFFARNEIALAEECVDYARGPFRQPRPDYPLLFQCTFLAGRYSSQVDLSGPDPILPLTAGAGTCSNDSQIPEGAGPTYCDDVDLCTRDAIVDYENTQDGSCPQVQLRRSDDDDNALTTDAELANDPCNQKNLQAQRACVQDYQSAGLEVIQDNVKFCIVDHNPAVGFCAVCAAQTCSNAKRYFLNIPVDDNPEGD